MSGGDIRPDHVALWHGGRRRPKVSASSGRGRLGESNTASRTGPHPGCPSEVLDHADDPTDPYAEAGTRAPRTLQRTGRGCCLSGSAVCIRATSRFGHLLDRWIRRSPYSHRDPHPRFPDIDAPFGIERGPGYRASRGQLGEFSTTRHAKPRSAGDQPSRPINAQRLEVSIRLDPDSHGIKLVKRRSLMVRQRESTDGDIASTDVAANFMRVRTRAHALWQMDRLVQPLPR